MSIIKDSRIKRKHKEEKYLEKAKKRLAAFYTTNPESGCWIWTGKTNHNNNKRPKPYGMFHFAEKWRLAHRVSYALHFGEFDILDNSDIICMHTCDTPLCINPKHLKLGTQAENMLDKRRKHRQFVPLDVCPHCKKEL